MTDPTPATAALRQAAQAARDAAAAQRWDDLAARLRHEAQQVDDDSERRLFQRAAEMVATAAWGRRVMARLEQS